jgi:hypothetical protein
MGDVEGIIQRIHDSQPQAVLAVAGAGNQSITWLLGVAGASRTLLEVLVPYGRLSMIGFLGHEPDQYVSSHTAWEMAGAAYRRALALREDEAPQPPPVVGIACTATIATDRPKRGEHRAYVAAWDETGCTTYGLLLNKGLRDRAGEDELVSRLVINALSAVSGVESELDLGLTDGDHLEVERTVHPDPIELLLAGEAGIVTVHPDGRMAVGAPVSAAILPGSFRPFHQGHQKLADIAGKLTGKQVYFELSVANVDKPPLEAAEIRERLTQFQGKATVVLTRAETFRKKAHLLPGCPFVIGWDTAVRLVAPRYYGDSSDEMLAALAEIWAAGCKILVAGRDDDGVFKTLADVPVPEGFRPLFQEITESQFREDVSSTALRAGS